MKQLILIVMLISLGLTESSIGQSNSPVAAKLVHRYEHGCGYSCDQELAIDIGLNGRDASNIMAVRLCSKGSLPMALATAAAPPFYVIDILTGSYNYATDRILLLRSEDCLGADPAKAATEYWYVPKGATLPPYVEQIKSCQVQPGVMGWRGMFKSERSYRAALRQVPKWLGVNPDRIGVVLGYYINRPSPVLERELNETERFLQRSGIPKDKYIVHLMRWTGEYEEDEPEPKFPNISIIEVAKACGGNDQKAKSNMR